MGRSKHFSPFDIEMMVDDAEMMVDDAEMMVDDLTALIVGLDSVVEYQYRSWK